MLERPWFLFSLKLTPLPAGPFEFSFEAADGVDDEGSFVKDMERSWEGGEGDGVRLALQMDKGATVGYEKEFSWSFSNLNSINTGVRG